MAVAQLLLLLEVSANSHKLGECLHKLNYICTIVIIMGCAGLFYTNQKSLVALIREVLIRVATLHKLTCHSSHKADDDIPE
jgi:hypothetical protein